VTDPLTRFAQEVGPDGPITVAGGRTQWSIGGLPCPGTWEVRAPSGVVAHQPAEMIVRVRAGTALVELQKAVGEAGQMVALEADQPSHATVGGLLAVGRSGCRRLGLGPVRDTLLEVTAVNSRGELIRAGAPLVKNVTGFDLCRLFVGSLGTLALTAEVVLRCRPVPEVETWYSGEARDPFDLLARLYRPLAILWDGTRVWVGLAGYRVDVEDQARTVLGPRFRPVGGPPSPPGPVHRSLPPAALARLPARLDGHHDQWLAEVGVGVVCCTAPAAELIGSEDPPKEIMELHRAIKGRFDPEGRLNPGRSVLSIDAVAMP